MRHAKRVEPTHGSSRTCAGPRGADGDHDRGDVHALAEKRTENGEPAVAVGAVEAVAEGVLGAGFAGQSTWLVRIGGTVQDAATAEQARSRACSA